MKTFRYATGHQAGKTLTVIELKEELAKYPDTMPVFGTWEGVTGFIESDGFSIVKVHKGNIEDACDCLLIDVENY